MVTNALLANLNPFDSALVSAMRAGSATAPDLSESLVAVAVNSSSCGGVKESPASIPEYNGVKSPALLTAHGLSGKSCPLSRSEVGPQDSIIEPTPMAPATSLPGVETTVSEKSLETASFFKARDRILAKIGPLNPNGCKLWTGRVTRLGYGRVTISDRQWFAHRAIWTLIIGPIPKGLCLLHKCDVPGCVNVDHLSLGTIKENFLDMDRKGRRNRHIPWLTNIDRKGEKASKAILVERQVIEIFHRHSAGIRVAELADEYEVSRSCIYSIVGGKKWKHLALRAAP